ncbi:GNAT family N-acetyltransferase [Mycobacterium sp. 4D054]|uniref:GNAT family N-acetyltransferase n=1 Tax=Mycobacterium sp. 4D054 TaxID=3457440 RepID=UPI003FD0FF61
MTLRFIDHHGDPTDRRMWTPFPSSEDFAHPDWWRDGGGTIGDPWFVQVLEAGSEVARVQLDDRGSANQEYTLVPPPGPKPWLKIMFIEVATSARRRGIGTRVVQRLVARHPDRRLLAYSEGADEFWGSLSDWERFDHPSGRHQPLFIAPARNPDPAVGARP